MNDHPLFSAQDAKREAIERVTRNASPVWIETAREIVLALASRMPHGFDADHVWRELEDRGAPAPRDPRALGGVFKSLARSGAIRDTGTMRKSRREQCHFRKITIWRAA